MSLPNNFRRALPAAAITAVLLLVGVECVQAGPDGNQSPARNTRNGGGLRVGQWDVQGLAGADRTSQSLAYEGYFQKGLDLHLVWENTLGFWQHTRTTTETGPLGSVERKVDCYLVPTLTTLKLYPLTRPSNPIEPFLNAGVGVTLGIARDSGAGTLGATSGAPSIQTGLGIQTGAGIEWHWSGIFGATAGYRYQWATFGEAVAGSALYRGPAYNLGLTYRFQYQ